MTKYVFINLFKKKILTRIFRKQNYELPNQMTPIIMMCHDNLYTSQLVALPCSTLYVNCDQIHL
jgi:hypothetical protein